MVLITHHMDETVGADRIVVMDGGRVVKDGTPREVFADVEGVRSLGMDVPETVSILYELRRRGCDLDLGALTPEACTEELYSYFA